MCVGSESFFCFFHTAGALRLTANQSRVCPVSPKRKNSSRKNGTTNTAGALVCLHLPSRQRRALCRCFKCSAGWDENQNSLFCSQENVWEGGDSEQAVPLLPLQNGDALRYVSPLNIDTESYLSSLKSTFTELFSIRGNLGGGCVSRNGCPPPTTTTTTTLPLSNLQKLLWQVDLACCEKRQPPSQKSWGSAGTWQAPPQLALISGSPVTLIKSDHVNSYLLTGRNCRSLGVKGSPSTRVAEPRHCGFIETQQAEGLLDWEWFFFRWEGAGGEGVENGPWICSAHVPDWIPPLSRCNSRNHQYSTKLQCNSTKLAHERHLEYFRINVYLIEWENRTKKKNRISKCTHQRC